MRKRNSQGAGGAARFGPAIAAAAVSTTRTGARRLTGTLRRRVPISSTTARAMPAMGCQTATAPARTAPIATAITAGLGDGLGRAAAGRAGASVVIDRAA